MKKKLLVVLMATMVAFTFTACGAKNDEKTEETAEKDGSGTSVDDIEVEKYVTLCELEGLEIPTNTYTFSDADVQEQMQSDFEYYVEMANKFHYEEITDRTDVQEGDFCNIDYEGTKDGVAFEGGTAQGYDLEIGSGSFIEGFEEGLIGHQVGEELDLDLTFPEEYPSADLAGQAVVFHVKINKIQSRSLPEMTDEIVADLGMDYSTVADLENEVKESLQEQCDERADEEQIEAIWSQLMEKCQVKEVPQELADNYTNEIMKSAESYAENYGVSLDEFIETYMQTDRDTFEKEIAENGKSAATQTMIMKAVANKAGLEVTEEELMSRAEAEYAEYQVESVDAFLDTVGKDNFKQYILQEKVEEYLKGVVKLVEGPEVNIFEADEMDYSEEDLSEEEILDDENVEVIDGEELELEGVDEGELQLEATEEE